MNLRLSTAPHIRHHTTTGRIMLDVIIALIPTTAAGIYFFGLSAALLIVLSMASAVLVEFLWQRIRKETLRINDLSALVTGLILGLNLPPTAPWWIAVLGSAVAILLVKQLFGGIGDNFLNPAIAARAVLLASWPVHMTTYILPTYLGKADAVTSATPLAGYQASTMDLFLGNIPGTIGEVCKAAILLGLIYMLLRKVIRWHIPVVFIGVTALFSWMLGSAGGFTFDGNPLHAILSGGVLFGAVFMATDYTTTPMAVKGQVIFAAGCGLMVSIIRAYGAYPEGVTYAILLMNIVTPLLDRFIKPNVYGYVPESKKEVKANA